MMEKKELPLTYETLFELMMREKTREELQKLETSFYADVRAYLQQKKEVLTDNSTDAFALQRRERTMQQLKNIRRLVTELYERRERKILIMAVVRSRTGSAVMDTSPLLAEERALFDRLVQELDASRSSVLTQVLDSAAGTRAQPSTDEDRKTIRFLSPVPSFVGRDLATYGPFDEGVTAELPSSLADILIQKGSAEEA